MTTDKPHTALKCLVIDDEPLARRAIVDFIAQVDFLSATASCGSALEAQELISKEKYDLLFLDINMPYLSGIDFLESISQPPMVIFTTAYSEHALEGYRLQIVDYLLKPITFKRFYQAALKAKELYLLKNQAREEVSLVESSMYIKHEDCFVKIQWTDILYIEAMQNYLKIHTLEKMYIIHQTMIAIEELLPKEHFFRIHKSYLINVKHISSLSGNRVFIHQIQLPIARQRKETLLNDIIYKNLLSK
ncbi:LytTR family DNA-binding domain-containing protein [Myroides sp. WP-1]|uniref:LytR/AlgR family response regulator transcription factor n=1 Tax=Myroides sp. WP-1 TaxID=2759944 RepID=UPI0015FC9FC4|nr:LytTR family DNA-binding domain-containing protein [Myroides sp. WP-1]MBB1137902.1 response regulator transcription factor [Myroides sp. WP-1]